MACFSFSDSARHVQRGFTLIELLIVLVVLSILLGMAVPSLRGSIARNQLLGQANELAGALALARSEAVTRGVQAGVCASSNGTACSDKSSDWNQHILIFVDEDRGSDFDESEPLLKRLDSHGEVTQSAANTAFYFNEVGFSSTNATRDVEVCHDKLAENNNCRTVRIAPTGVISVINITKKA